MCIDKIDVEYQSLNLNFRAAIVILTYFWKEEAEEGGSKTGLELIGIDL